MRDFGRNLFQKVYPFLRIIHNDFYLIAPPFQIYNDYIKGAYPSMISRMNQKKNSGGEF